MESPSTDVQPAGGAGLYISQVAQMMGIAPATIRLWERQGLVTPARTISNYRVFSLEEIEQIRRVRDLIQNGLNIAGVKHVLANDGRAERSPRIRQASRETEEVGLDVRRRRRQRGISLRKLAAMTGLSASYLSSLERGISRPSMATIQKLAAALGTNIAEMLGDEAPDPSALVVRRSRRRRVRLGAPGITMEQLSTQERILEPTYVTIDPLAGAEEPYQHEGEEFVFVLAGNLEVTIEERETHLLGKGDAITFPSHRPHRWRNPGDTETRLIWVNTPPTF
jgi:DNA-binding transcriptional MerR regulator/quercetin dioxygenase-like cupin family protein